MTPKIYISGKYYDKPDAKISVYDHGLLYGDGVFEGIRIYNSKVFRLHEHIVRLYESARSIKLEIPLSQVGKNINGTVAPLSISMGINSNWARTVVSWVELATAATISPIERKAISPRAKNRSSTGQALGTPIP